MDRHTKGEGSFTSHLKASRGQSLLPIFDPPPPHTVHTLPPPESSSTPPSSVSSGEKAKARDILAAIRTLQAIEAERRHATTDERSVLSRFGGFGAVALSLFPDPKSGQYKPGWDELGHELESLLTPEEYSSAKRTTFTAFYTSPVVMTTMHSALERLGVPDTAIILEPGAGTGNFLAHGKPSQRYIGVELDSLSGRLARVLHPNADIRIENFRDTKLPALDAVIGNVPFADVKLDWKGQRLSLHDYFISKSLNSLKSGGVLAVVTSHYTLDKQNSFVREALAEQADFLGAIRLPSDAFKREGTSVVTDILFLRKRAPGQEPNHAADWITTGTLALDGASVPVNRYFLEHPEMVLGDWSRKDTLYAEGYSVTSNGDLAGQLKEAIAKLPGAERSVAEQPNPPPSRDPADIFVGRISSPSFIPPPPLKHIAEGSFFVGDDKIIRQVVDGTPEPVTYCGVLLRTDGTPQARKIGSLIELRDLARRVLQSQNEGWPEENREATRRDLNRAYDRFVTNYGPINKTTQTKTKADGWIRRMPNVVKFREDPDAMLVMALEEYDEATERAEKAAIMKRDVVGPKPPVSHVTSAEEGLLVSLDHKGAVDLGYISQLYGKPENEIVKELDDLIYRDPETKEWQTADAYLSGNVRHKLAIAEAAGPEYQHNAAALKAVQPEDVLPGDIDANLGAPWIPADDIRAFAESLFEGKVTIGHLKKDAHWSVDADYRAKQSVAATTDYGTMHINGTTLLEHALNLKTPVIYDTIVTSDGKQPVVNPEATLAAKEKQKVIKEKFKAWVFSDADRTERLVRIYNDTYNNLRPRLFDGSHLEFPGKSNAITLRPHQEDAVWRCMSGGNTLLAHVVGGGKTIAACASAMKMKQAGLINKPLLVCPNHMLEQFSREFQQLYPNARILTATKDDFAKDRRKALTAKIATGDWDGIIVTHSGFERIGMSKEYQEKFLRDQIVEYEDLLISCAGEGRNILKQIEKGKARREERLKELLAEDKKDSGLVFDELGIDQIFIDEFQYFKNLEAPTKMDRVAGIPSGGSERAFDLYMKCRYLDEKHPGHGLVGMSGTPISNSMVEVFTLQRYFDPHSLRERGIDHLDGWAATFGEVTESMEISPDGQTLKPRSRFDHFINVPDLSQMFRSFADVQTAEMLNLPRPTLEGGKPQTIACPMSDEQAELQAGLVKRYERIRNERVDLREDNALNITTDGRKLALDGRMLGGHEDFSGSKTNALVANVARIWRESGPIRGTQLIFCDLGVHPNPFSVYDAIAEKLIDHGIPRAQIAVMGDADTDAKKQALFEKVRSGSVRVLIGSTQKMGTGTNVQKRLVALHHLDVPWKPSEIEQRDGRILRQGNMNPEVGIYRYVTTGSFDAFMWQANETKARYINQFMAGGISNRRMEDISSQELSYAEVKAIASGNPAVLTLAEADAEMQRLAVLKRNHRDEQYMAGRQKRELPDTIGRLVRRIAGLEADMATSRSDHIDATESIARRLERLPEGVHESREYPLGTYRGLSLGFVLYPSGSADVTLEGKAKRSDQVASRGIRAVTNAAERIVNSYGFLKEEAERDLEVARGRLRDYEARLGQEFAHEKYMSQLSDLRDRLRLALSDHPPEGEKPSAEIAAEIQALRASVTVEEAPQRQARVSTAEEPVSRRIRKKKRVEPDVEGAAETSPEPVQEAPPVIPVPVSSHRHHVASRRQGAESQMRMF